MSELLKCENLSKRFGSKVALDRVSLTVERGKIIGPNGAGKTTLIKLINGLLTPTEGTILVDGDKPGPKTKAKVQETHIRSSGEGTRNPLQYACLEHSIDRRAWQATVHRVTSSWT